MWEKALRTETSAGNALQGLSWDTCLQAMSTEEHKQLALPLRDPVLAGYPPLLYSVITFIHQVAGFACCMRLITFLSTTLHRDMGNIYSTHIHTQFLPIWSSLSTGLPRHCFILTVLPVSWKFALRSSPLSLVWKQWQMLTMPGSSVHKWNRPTVSQVGLRIKRGKKLN